MSFLSFGISLFVLASAAVFLRLHVVKQRVHVIDTAVKQQREASHELANEATKLKQATKKIAEAPDPYRELMRVLSGKREQHRRSHHP